MRLSAASRIFGGQKQSINSVSRPGAIALIDASIVYGASRWFRGVHKDPTWEYAAQYLAGEDQLLFLEFLHDLLLYDTIVLDCSSVEKIGRELFDLKAVVNAESGEELIQFRAVAPEITLRHVVGITCRLLANASNHSHNLELLQVIPVPWYYRDASHHDRAAFERSARTHALPDALLPLAIFVYRGICYSGYSRHFTATTGVSSAYVASPGRVAALSPILDAKAMALVTYPRAAYTDLIDLLKLPEKGYDFSHLSLPGITPLTQSVYDLPAVEAISATCKLRQCAEAKKLRSDWSERVWRTGTTAMVGATRSNVIANSTIFGDVFQTLTIGSAKD